jgi:membrane associated rhomboid family serine protease
VRVYRYSYSPGLAIYGWSPMVKALIITNTIIFLLQIVLPFQVVVPFSLVPDMVIHKLYFWQLFTYMFLHGGFFHLFFNMFVLWMFGSEVEGMWGSREFLRYYFITGIGAAIFYTIVCLIFPALHPEIPTIGASGAIFGLLVAFAMIYPNRLIYLYFLFPIKAKHLVIFFALLELFASVHYTDSGIANVAHLGGMLVGFLYIKGGWRIDSFYGRIKDYLKGGKIKIRMVDDHDTGSEGDWMDDEDEIDRILDKISSSGIDSLTDEEKGVLNRASKRIRHRK